MLHRGSRVPFHTGRRWLPAFAGMTSFFLRSRWLRVLRATFAYSALSFRAAKHTPTLVSSIIVPRRQRAAIVGDAAFEADQEARLLTHRIIPVAATGIGKRDGLFAGLPYLLLNPCGQIQVIGEAFETRLEMSPLRDRRVLLWFDVVPV